MPICYLLLAVKTSLSLFNILEVAFYMRETKLRKMDLKSKINNYKTLSVNTVLQP